MVYFAELDSNNIVIRVIVGNPESVSYPKDPAGEEFCSKNIPNDPTISLVDGKYPGVKWKQTFDDGTTRGNYAGIGFLYDEQKDAFIAPKPFPSWILDSGFKWNPPIGFPIVDDLGNTLPRGALYPDSLSIYWSEEDLTYKGIRIVDGNNVVKKWNNTNLTWEQI